MLTMAIKQTKTKYTPQGYSKEQFAQLTRELAEYAKTKGEKRKTFYLDGEIKYAVTVIGWGGAYQLYYTLTGKFLDEFLPEDEKIAEAWFQERVKHSGRFTGKVSSGIIINHKNKDFTADDAMRLYGHPFHAAKILESQLNAIDQNDKQYKPSRTDSVASELKERALGTATKVEYSYYSGKWREITTIYDTEKELAKMGAPLTPIGSHTLTVEEQAELDELIAEKERAAQREYEPQQRIIPVKERYQESRGWYAKVGDIENAGKDDKIDLYNADGTPLLHEKGKYKGQQRSCLKKKLFWEYYDLHPERKDEWEIKEQTESDGDSQLDEDNAVYNGIVAEGLHPR